MTNIKRKSTPSCTMKIWMAGNVADAERVCREFCWDGFCVTVTPTNYIYAGGEQSGFVVGIINYARFPSFPDTLLERAEVLGRHLMKALHQKSFSIETPVDTYYYERTDGPVKA